MIALLERRRTKPVSLPLPVLANQSVALEIKNYLAASDTLSSYRHDVNPQHFIPRYEKVYEVSQALVLHSPHKPQVVP